MLRVWVLGFWGFGLEPVYFPVLTPQQRASRADEKTDRAVLSRE